MKKFAFLAVLLISLSGCSQLIQSEALTSSEKNPRYISGEIDAQNEILDPIAPHEKINSHYIYRTSNKIILSLNARIGYDTLAGFASVLRIKVNGKTLSQENITNKPQVRYYSGENRYQFTLSNGNSYWWFDTINDSWNVPYADTFNSNDLTGGQYRVIGGESTVYEFDITELLEKAIGEMETINTIEIENNGTINCNLYVGGVKIYEEISNIVINEKEIASTAKFKSADLNIDDPENMFIRFFSRINYGYLAGCAFALNIYTENTNSQGTIYKYFDGSTIMNKAQNSNSYVGPMVYTLQNLGRYDMIDGNNNFTLFYSNNYTDNNLLNSKYRVIGGQAYQFDLSFNRHIAGSYNLYFKNVLTNYNISIQDATLYKALTLSF